jgi:hypothetical protein
MNPRDLVDMKAGGLAVAMRRTERVPCVARRETEERSRHELAGNGADMSLLVIVGMLVIEVLLFWGYVVLVERSGSAVVRGVLGAGLVATLLAMGLWLIYDNALILIRAD